MSEIECLGETGDCFSRLGGYGWVRARDDCAISRPFFFFITLRVLQGYYISTLEHQYIQRYIYTQSYLVCVLGAEELEHLSVNACGLAQFAGNTNSFKNPGWWAILHRTWRNS